MFRPDCCCSVPCVERRSSSVRGALSGGTSGGLRLGLAAPCAQQNAVASRNRFSACLCSRVSGSHWGLIRKYGLNINRQSFRELAKDIGFVKVSGWVGVHLLCFIAVWHFTLRALAPCCRMP